MNFDALNIQPEIMRAIDEMGFETMTPIQEEAIPIAMTGRDLIAQAQTGTGKTAAFAIPMLQNVQNNEELQVLVLTPTRELCIQVEKEIHKLSRHLSVRSMAIYGGQDIVRQIKGLKNRPEIIVATPGRLMDHMRRNTIRMDNLTTVILDEADEMLNMGFLEDIETILSACPEQRQTLMFSATVPQKVRGIADSFMHDPQEVRIKATELTVPAIEQIAYTVYEEDKLSLLTRLLDMSQPELVVIFGRTKRRVDELTRALQHLGYRAEGLHGDLSQYQRDNVMYKFRNNQIDILVATDVAARGLDISNVSHVVNFDLPQDADSYVHRIGRTGRAGQKGLAISFIAPSEKGHMSYIERVIKHHITRRDLPTERDHRTRRRQLLIDSVVMAIQDGAITNYKEVAEELIEQYGAEESLSAVLKLLAGDASKRAQEAKQIKLTSERPMFSSKQDRNRRKNYGKDQKNKGGYAGKKGGYKPKKNRYDKNQSYNKQKSNKQNNWD